MDDTDAFFTRTIVGAPSSMLLGRRMSAERASALGLNVDLRTGHARLPQAWADFAVLGRADDARGQPRRRPGSVTRWLERHALILAAGGLAAWIGALLVLARARSWI